MVGTIEELEKEIEQFQRNVMASGEIVTLLNEMVDQIKMRNESFENKSKELISRIDSLPENVEKTNMASNAKLTANIVSELEKYIKYLDAEQNRYLQGLEKTRQQIQNNVEQSISQVKVFHDKIGKLLDGLDSVLDQIKDDNLRTNDEMKQAIDKLLKDRNRELIAEQDKYVSLVQGSSEVIKDAEHKLDEKYKEFIDTLDNMNISTLSEQNKQLMNELNKRTTIIAIISGISVILGVVGLFI